MNSQCIGHGLVNLQPDGACVVAKLPKLGGEPFEPLDTHTRAQSVDASVIAGTSQRVY